MFGAGKKNSSGWRSGGESGPKRGSQRISEAFDEGADEVREQVRTIFSSDTGRLLVLGDVVLELVSRPVGRLVVAALALTGAWALL
jgi:hypothetical protein